MRTFVVLAVSIVLVSILFCPMAMAEPPIPADLQMVQPDPSLPKELSAFFGKWESIPYPAGFFVIIEKIDEEKASFYIWRSGMGAWPEGTVLGWQRIEGKVIKDRGKYKIWYRGPFGNAEYTLKGEKLVVGNADLRRVP
jgi:hypothetical protein